MRAVIPSVVETLGRHVVSINTMLDAILCSHVRCHAVDRTQAHIRSTAVGIATPIHRTSSHQTRPVTERAAHTKELARDHGRSGIQTAIETVVNSIYGAPSSRDSRTKRVAHAEEMCRHDGIGRTERSAAAVGQSRKRHRTREDGPILLKQGKGHGEWVEDGRGSRRHTCTGIHTIICARGSVFQRLGVALNPDILEARHGFMVLLAIDGLSRVESMRGLKSLDMLLGTLKIVQIVDVLSVVRR